MNTTTTTEATGGQLPGMLANQLTDLEQLQMDSFTHGDIKTIKAAENLGQFLLMFVVPVIFK